MPIGCASRPGRRGSARARAGALLLAVGLLPGLGLAACAASLTAAVAPCRADAVRITVGQFGVGQGHFGGPLLFSNMGPDTCRLQGYPLVAASSARGHGRVDVARTPRGYLGGLLPGTSRLPVVILAPGGIASAILEGSSVAVARGPRCPPAGVLHVGIPGGQPATALAIETTACSRLQVHPVVLGRSGHASP